MEILAGARDVYTIFVKSRDTPFYLIGGYEYLLSDFKTFTPTQPARMRKSRAVSPEDRGWNQETLDYFRQYFSPESSLTWGIFPAESPR